MKTREVMPFTAGVRLDTGSAQLAAGAARSVRVADGGGVRGAVQRRRVHRHRGLGDGARRLAARLLSSDIQCNEDQSTVRTRFAANNLAIVRHIVMNLLRLNKSRKGSIKTKRMLDPTSDTFRAELLGLMT